MLAWLATRAWACSCETFDLARTLPKADGAFVGVLVARDQPLPFFGPQGEVS